MADTAGAARPVVGVPKLKPVLLLAGVVVEAAGAAEKLKPLKPPPVGAALVVAAPKLNPVVAPVVVVGAAAV